MTYSLTFELEGLPKSQTNNYGHWRTRAKSKKDWEDRVIAATITQWPKDPLTEAKLTFTRCSSSEPDFDNLVASFKPVMDGLVRARIILDDKPSVVGQPQYRWEKAAPKQGKIRVQVVEPSVEIGPRVIQGRKRHE